MLWQRSYIERNLSLGATSGTKTIDLPKTALLSQVLLRFTATNGANRNMDNHIFDKVSKIEVIVNGSEVVKSLSGVQAQALAFFNSKHIPARRIIEAETHYQWEEFPIYFGRYPGDLEYGLDTSRVVNPQLKITWDTTGAGADATSIFSITTFPVIDVMVEQLVEPDGISFTKGYIKAHQIVLWSPTSNSEEKRVELPVGNKYKAIYVRCVSTAWEPRQALSKVFLDLNVGVKQPFKMDEAEWRAWNRELFGEVELTSMLATAGGTFNRELSVAYLNAMAGTATATDYVTSGGGSGSRHDIRTVDADGSQTEGKDVWMIVKGELYHQFFALPLDYPDDRFMLDSSKWSDVDLVLEAAASGIATILPDFYILTEEVILK